MRHRFVAGTSIPTLQAYRILSNTVGLEIIFFWAFASLFFFYFRLFNTVGKIQEIEGLLIIGFEPWTSGVGSGSSTNTAPLPHLTEGCLGMNSQYSLVEPYGRWIVEICSDIQSRQTNRKLFGFFSQHHFSSVCKIEILF